jgi:predicted RNA-binding Zn ribbon-like protein
MNSSASPTARPEQVLAGFDPAHLPILGEPLPIEFANTWYSNDGTMIDFLATREMAAAWFAHAPAAGEVVLPAPLTDKFIADLRELRNAIHALCGRVTAGARTVPSAQVAVVNRAAVHAAAHLELDWMNDHPPTANLAYRGVPADVSIAHVASESITFFAGADRTLLRQCATPGCEVFFVQRHHRRRFCSEPCSQRTRQNRYYRNHRTSPDNDTRTSS